MSHFSAKSLTFYSVAISSVLILFKVVSTYGEKNLVAASEIGGIYQISEAQNLPGCLANQSLNLTIEQSGVYLFGNLADRALIVDDNTKATFPMSGSFKDQEIAMSGNGQLASCEPGLELTLQGHREKESLVGTIKNSDGSEGSFSAQYQAAEPESTETH
jgi:hypothetical protein